MDEEQVWTGSRLRGVREQAGIKLQDLAGALSLDLALLSRMETGHRSIPADLPDRYVSTVRRIARERAEAVGAFDQAPEPVTVP